MGKMIFIFEGERCPSFFARVQLSCETEVVADLSK